MSVKKIVLSVAVAAALVRAGALSGDGGGAPRKANGFELPTEPPAPGAAGMPGTGTGGIGPLGTGGSPLGDGGAGGAGGGAGANPVDNL